MDYDAIIVGAGIGAGVLGRRLSSAGRRVIVLDRTAAGSPPRGPVLVRPEILWESTTTALSAMLPPHGAEQAFLPLEAVDVTCGGKTREMLGARAFRLPGVHGAATDPDFTRTLLLRDAPFEVRRGVEVIDLIRDGDRVRGVRCRHVSTTPGDEFDITAPVVVGDDGGKSKIRQLLNVPLRLTPFPMSLACAGLEWPASLPPRRARIWLNTTRPRSGIAGMLAIPFPSAEGGAGRGASVVLARPESLEPSSDPAAAWSRFVQSDAVLRDTVGSRTLPNDFVVVKREWGHADRYGDPTLRGTFLIGDAVHPVSPAGGQGANMSATDANALADVLLAEPIENVSSDALVRYERRRRAANERSVRITRTTARGLALPRWVAPLWVRPIVVAIAEKVLKTRPSLLQRGVTSFVERATDKNS